MIWFEKPSVIGKVVTVWTSNIAVQVKIGLLIVGKVVNASVMPVTGYGNDRIPDSWTRVNGITANLDIIWIEGKTFMDLIVISTDFSLLGI